MRQAWESEKDALGRELHGAIKERRPDRVRGLLAAGAALDFEQGGRTPLRWAAVCGAWECAEALLKAGARPGAEANGGVSALALAARAKSGECVKAMLKAGADPNETDHEGVSPLHWAVRSLSAGVVEELLAAGARVNATAGDVRATPLHFACWEWRPESESLPIVQALVRCGADPLARLEPLAPAKNWTPAEICSEFGRSGLWRFLEPLERSQKEAREIERATGPGVKPRGGSRPM